MRPTITHTPSLPLPLRVLLTLYAVMLSHCVVTPAHAQSNPPSNLTLLSAPGPNPVLGVSASNNGNSGNNSYCWWVIPTYPIGDGPISPTPACLSQINGPSAANTVTVSWPATPSATNYRVLRTTTPTFPNGVCTGCSLTTTATTSYTDTGAAGTDYTPGTVGGVSYSLSLDNLSNSVPLVKSQLGPTTYTLPQLTGTPTTGNCVSFAGPGVIQDSGSTCGGGGGGGNVSTAVTLTANLPIVGAGGSAIAVGTRTGNTTQYATSTGAQTSGACVSIDASGNHITTPSGTPCVTSTGGPFTTGLPLVGAAGTGANIATGTRTGNTTAFATSTGATTTNNCAKWDANGNIVDAGSACGGATTTATPYATLGSTVIGPVYTITLPSTPTWAWTNQGTATITVSAGGAQTISAAASASVDLKLRTTTAPVTPYTLTAMVKGTGPNQNFIRMGVGFRESATGKIKTISSSAGAQVSVDNWTNATTFSGTNTTLAWTFGAGVTFYQLTNDGADISLKISGDGVYFYPVITETVTTFFTTAPDELVFFVDTNNATFPASLTLLSWATT